MQISFVLPSCNYNIVMTQKELQRLIETGHSDLIRPEKTTGCFIDEYGNKQNNISGMVTYTNRMDEYPIQFITINVEKE